MDVNSETKPRVLQSSLKCLKLLKLLAAEGIPMALGALSERSGQPKGTVHQQLRTLIEAGYVERNPGGSYQISMVTITLGSAALEQAGIGARVASGVAALAARSGETASLSILRDGEVLIVYRVSTDSSLMTDLAPGSTMPVTQSASGRVLQAYSAHLVQEDNRAFAEIRSKGFALSVDEFLTGMSTIAVPVRLPGVGVAALSLAAPTFRFDREKLLGLLTRSRVL